MAVLLKLQYNAKHNRYTFISYVFLVALWYNIIAQNGYHNNVYVGLNCWNGW